MWEIFLCIRTEKKQITEKKFYCFLFYCPIVGQFLHVSMNYALIRLGAFAAIDHWLLRNYGRHAVNLYIELSNYHI